MTVAAIQTPIPTGPRQYAVTLSLSTAVTPKGATDSFTGSLQPFVANDDGSNPLILGAAQPLAVGSDPDVVQLKADIQAAVQTYVKAKGL